MLTFLRTLASVSLLFACLLLIGARDVRADSVTLDASTTLNDNTNFTAGTTYYAVFQLVGGGTDNNSALLSNFRFGSGAALSRDSSDPTSGTFLVTPNPNSSEGVEQTGAMLTLNITPGDAFSLYSQQFVAGDSFSFDFSLTNNFAAGNSFDGFTFQLYDAELSVLLFERSFDITGALQPQPQPVPEPATLLLLGTGLLGAAVRVRRRGTGS